MERRDFLNKSVIALVAGAVVTSVSACSKDILSPASTTHNNKGEEDPMIANFPAPQIMNWTILPITFMAKCWIDPEYKSEFLTNPTAHFAARSSLVNMPANFSCTVHENTTSVRTFPLPHMSSALATLTRSQVSTLLTTEVGTDQSLEWTLPADVIEEALYNSTFKNQLLLNPQSALSSMGYSTGLTIVVLENTSSHYNLALPTKPATIASSTTYSAALAIASTNMDLASSKCCATGTCDDDDDVEPYIT